MKGIYTEHCLEHISFASCQQTINELFRICKPGGVVRIIVPDAELYIDLYTRSKNGENVIFPYVTDNDIHRGISPIISVNSVFRDHGHLFAYDYSCIAMMLNKAGFRTTKKESFMKGRDSTLLIDSESRKIESLYVEASKLA
jgi:predicted SAM-dependent methyltransferase